jgi:hypothetical protein
MNYTAIKRLYLTADQKRVVAVQSHEAGYLFRGLGQVVTQAEVDKYGLGSDLVRPNRETSEASAPAQGKTVEESTAQDQATTEPPKTKADTTGPAKPKKGRKQGS